MNKSWALGPEGIGDSETSRSASIRHRPMGRSDMRVLILAGAEAAVMWSVLAPILLLKIHK